MAKTENYIYICKAHVYNAHIIIRVDRSSPQRKWWIKKWNWSEFEGERKREKNHFDISNEMNEKSYWWYLIVRLSRRFTHISFIILLYVCNLSMYRERDMWICVIYFRALDSQFAIVSMILFYLFSIFWFFPLTHFYIVFILLCGS